MKSDTRSCRWIIVLAFVSALVGSSTVAQELVSYPSQEVAFICGPQLRSNSPLNPYPWFDSTATSKGASVAASLPAKAPRVLTGTVSVNTNSSIVTGNDTRFLAQIDPNGPAPYYNGRLRIRDLNYATRINIHDPGSGYTSTPTVTITGGGGSGAAAVAVVSNGEVVEVIITSGGSNYNQVPSITFSGGSPTRTARADAAISGGVIVGNAMRSVQVTSIQDDTHMTLTVPWSYSSVTAVPADTYHYDSYQAAWNFDDFYRGMYYDTALTMYINYYRTNDPAFLTYARKLADAWWGSQWMKDGTVVGGPDNLPPRAQAYAGLMLRALDGKPQYWDYLYRQGRATFDHYIKIRRNDPNLYLDTREAGYAQLYAVLLARVLPDQYPLYGNGTLAASTGTATDGAQKRAALLADLEDLAVNYFGRLQKPDGSWRFDVPGEGVVNTEQPFMTGLYLESVILLHQLSTNSSVKANLVNQLTKSVTHLHNDAYEKNVPVTNFPPYKWRATVYYWGGGTVAQPNLYNPPAPRTTACGLQQCGENSVAVARQLNATIHHAFGYAYVATGDAQYKTMGDEMFGASFGDSTDTVRNLAADVGGKEYAINYRASGRYLAWRIADPNPTNQPLTWTEVAYATPEADGGIATTTLESPTHAAAVQQLTSGKYIEIVPNQVQGNSQYRINTVGNRNVYRRLSIGGGYLHFYNTAGAWQDETTVTTSSVIRISLEGTDLRIYKDGTLVYTFTDTLNGPFEFRMSFWVENTNLGAGLTSASISGASPRTNVALASNGATASASSTYAGTVVSATINGDRKGLNYGTNGSWASGSSGFPQWLQVDFNGSQTIDEIDVFTLQDNYPSPSEPTETMTFSLYGLSGYEVLYWNGTSWATVTGTVSGNNKVWRKFTFTAVTTSKIRVWTNASPSGWSELTEVEAWTTTPSPRTNVALASNGATASASSTYAGTVASATINGDRKGLNYGTNGSWASGSSGFPQWLQVDFNGSQTIDEIDVFTLQDNYPSPSEPTEAMTFSLWGLSGYEVQYWNGSTWVTITGGSVSGNDKVWRKFTFTAITTTKIKVLTNSSPSGWSELTEVEAWTSAP